MKKKYVKTPSMVQIETVDCGAVALGIILAYYGCFVSIETLRLHCRVSRHGANLLSIMKAAQYFGLNVSCLDQIPQEADGVFPMILFWKKRHFVVLEGFKKTKFYINDPQKGRYTLSEDLFYQYFSGQALKFSITDRFQKQKKISAWAYHLKRLYQRQFSKIVWLCGMMPFLIVLNMMIPLWSKVYIEHYAAFQSEWPLSFGLGLWLCLCVHVSLNWMHQTLLRDLEQDYAETLSHQVMKKLLTLSPLFFAHRRVAALCSLFKSVQLVSVAMTGPVFLACMYLFQSLVYAAIMIYFQWSLGVIAIGFALVQIACLAWSDDKMIASYGMTQEKMINLTTLVSDYITDIRSIKATGHEDFFIRQCERRLEEHLQAYREFSKKDGMKQSLYLMMTIGGYSVTMVLGVLSLSYHQMTISALIAFNMIFFALNQSLGQLLKLKNRFHRMTFHDQKIKDVTQSRHIVHDAMDYRVLDHHSWQGEVSLIDVTFGYDRAGPPLFHKLNLTIHAHTRTAIIGASGSGKTTLMYLIAGLYQPWSGEILLDGIPLHQLSSDARAKVIGMVSQEQFFFKGSIKENLCLWDDYSDEAVWDVIRDACLEDCLAQYKDGLAFQLTHGATNVSGGQRQRLEIARTLLRRPKILCMDEATSALDPWTEIELYRHLSHQPRTLIMAAHRLSTVRHAQNVVILNNGVLIDEGTPQALMSKNSADLHPIFSFMS